MIEELGGVANKQVKYRKYTDKDRVVISKYAEQHGSRRAARKFENKYPQLNESIVRSF